MARLARPAEYGRLARVAWLASLVGWADGPRLVGLLSWLGYTAEGKFGGKEMWKESFRCKG